MLIVIFTYNREKMVKELINSVPSHHRLVVIDDGTKGINRPLMYDICDTFYPTQHTGKKGFYNKWQLAFKDFNGSLDDYVCFLPDDVTNVDWESIERFTKQGWDNMRFAINLSNSGTRYRWGKWSTGQPDFEINDMLLQECGYVDGLFITNRHTLEGVTIDPVPESWFTRPDKSSGVGYQLSMKLREKHVKMMIPEFSYLYHGDHESVMHKEHRKAVPLISKIKK